jgi:hypothetical protein
MKLFTYVGNKARNHVEKDNKVPMMRRPMYAVINQRENSFLKKVRFSDE